MEQTKKFELDGVQYVMTPANASRAWAALKNALKLAQHIQLNGETQGNKTQLGANVLAGVLANLGDPSVKALETLVLEHTTANDVDNKPYRLDELNFDKHFNLYRTHLFAVLKEGLIYQFGDFFKGGSALLNITLPQLAKQAGNS